MTKLSQKEPKKSNKTLGSKTKVLPKEQTGAAALARLIYTKPGYLFRRTQQIAVSLFLEEAREVEVTPLQYGTLEVIRAFPGIDQSGLGNSLGLDRTTVVGIVDRLERKGWLTRETSDQDRRMRLLFLTSEGEQRIQAARPFVEIAQQRMMEALTSDEATFFLKCLARIVAHHNDNSRVPVKQSGRGGRGEPRQ